ncbi:hypothetical protein D9611_002542 [Ephemerocybe angulata]|uniref:Uncharacterized protein n=1 Tax=Ephemerocybe angulata TaxID=980116 RepID=A0A8H5FED0_9AGAR|nr:hypothetical protein D9611_002542 [Tulosesus angulatus]
MKIEWSNSYRSDGTARRPPPNSLHGWLAKMRGTLIGDEDLRSRGIREMKDAKRYKDRRRQASPPKGFLGGVIYEEPRPQATRRSTQRSTGPRLTKDSRSGSYSSTKKSHRSQSQATSSPRPRTAHRSASSKTVPGSYSVPSPRPTVQRRGTANR